MDFVSASLRTIFFVLVGLVAVAWLIAFSVPEQYVRFIEHVPTRGVLFLFGLGFLAFVVALVWSVIYGRTMKATLQRLIRAVLSITIISAGGTLIAFPKIEQFSYDTTLGPQLSISAYGNAELGALVFAIGLLGLCVLAWLRFLLYKFERTNGVQNI